MHPRIYITTYARPNDQRTWHRLTPKLQKITVLSVDWEERDLYKGYPIDVLPEGLSRLSPKRQYILQNAPAKSVILLDDDLQFYTRKNPGDWHLRDSTLADTEQMFFSVLANLTDGEYAAVGVSPREGNNNHIGDVLYNTRMSRVLGFHLPTIHKIIKYPLVDCQEDFDITLQLLSHGEQNVVFYRWAQGQGVSNAEGGCATYRTYEYQEERSRELYEKYPEWVTLWRKKTKVAWGGAERVDVRILWKKAYKYGTTHPITKKTESEHIRPITGGALAES